MSSEEGRCPAVHQQQAGQQAQDGQQGGAMAAAGDSALADWQTEFQAAQGWCVGGRVGSGEVGHRARRGL